MSQKIFKVFFTIFLISISAESARAGDWNFFKPSRNYIYITGSSTVSPFMSSVSEEFNRNQSLKNPDAITPVVESVGSTAGFQMFCGGVGLKYPDFVDASRLIKENEEENCHRNGVKEIVEIKIGYDGIVVGNSTRARQMQLTKEQIFLALADKVYDKKSAKLIDNPYQTWDQIDEKLPKTKITVYGPPLTSGTREVFVDLAMEEACFMKKEFISAYKDRDARRRQCRKIRDDGHFVESGENDNLIIQNLENNKDALGIFGFNFLVVNQKDVQAVKIDGSTPSFETIASKKYELSRPLFVYFKKEHLKLVPEMADFIQEIIDTETIGSKGYLVHSGLITMSDEELQEVKKDILLQLEK